jgi:hypothetical protein
MPQGGEKLSILANTQDINPFFAYFPLQQKGGAKKKKKKRTALRPTLRVLSVVCQHFGRQQNLFCPYKPFRGSTFIQSY